MLSAPVLRRRHLFDRSDDEAFVGVGGAATEACRVTAATNEGLVRFQKAVQWTRPILAQPMAQLVCHGPGRLIRHIEFALEKLGRNPALIAAHQISSKKPLGQIGSRPVKHRSSGRRFLPVAARTFIYPWARLQPPRLTSAAPGTGEPARPAKPGQMFDTLLLGPKPHHKLSQPSHNPPSERIGYATLRGALSPEHFMNLSYLERDTGGMHEFTRHYKRSGPDAVDVVQQLEGPQA